MKAYRIVEVDSDGEYLSLFHGTNGSRVLKRGVWLHATRKMVRDGSGGTAYYSGWHALQTRAEAEQYLTRFSAPRELRVVEVEVADVRPKPTNERVILARRMRIPEADDEQLRAGIQSREVMIGDQRREIEQLRGELFEARNNIADLGARLHNTEVERDRYRGAMRFAAERYLEYGIRAHRAERQVEQLRDALDDIHDELDDPYLGESLP